MGIAEPINALLCFGGFVYFDAQGEVVRINALHEDDGSSAGFFVFEGPFPLHQVRLCQCKLFV